MTRALVMALLLAGCAHAPPPPAGPPPKPDEVALYIAENGQRPWVGRIGLVEVCVDQSGAVRTLRVLHPLPRPDDEENIRRSRFKARAGQPCFKMFVNCDTCSDQTPPPDDASPTFATSRFKNVPWLAFADELIWSTLPPLPDEVKVRHVGERVGWTGKICASADGRIARTEVLQSIPGADEAITSVIRQWRLAPQPSGEGLCTMWRITYDAMRKQPAPKK